jgi:hypothetical protein
MVHGGTEWYSTRTVPVFYVDDWVGKEPLSAAKRALDVLSLNNAHDGEYVITVSREDINGISTFTVKITDGSPVWRNESAPSQD